jgi:Gas vesicle synthesis protein GvpL/GvpF
MSGDTGVWTYAITGQELLSGPDGEVDLTWLTGIGEEQVRTITCSGLTVLGSDVSLAEFGDAALRGNLENLNWLDDIAQLHHYVIGAAARLFPLLPVRLATVYGSDADVCAALTHHRDQLRDTLHRLGGRVEWGVKAYAAPEPEGRAQRDPAPREPVGAGAGPSGGATGQAYLGRRRAEPAAGRESPAVAVNGARAVHARLARQAEAAMLRPPQSPQLSGVQLPMLLNAAYLAHADAGPNFTAAVAGEAAAHPELRIELTGPWPPYSFTGDDDDGAGH